MQLRPTILGGFAALLLLGACDSPGKDETGDEYMPDMAHSIAYEANVYFDYYYNQWDSASVKNRYALSQPGLPVEGTVPRGYAGFYLAGQQQGQGVSAYESQLAQMREQYGVTGLQTVRSSMNGWAPYYYVDTEADRVRATNDLTTNPFPITEDGLKRGQELYETFCGICHGNDGGGNGYIYENGAYPAAPRNFLDQAWVDTTAGAYYHAIMYGKNVMGAYKDKMNYEERYQVIHYIRALQAKWGKLQYDQAVNTLKPNEATPGVNVRQYATFLDAFNREPIDFESSSNTDKEVVPGSGPTSDVPGETPNASDTTAAVGRAVGGLTPKPATGQPAGKR